MRGLQCPLLSQKLLFYSLVHEWFYIPFGACYSQSVHLVKQHTDFPAPEVFAWCSDPSNPVGAEYIIMEKAAGVQLFQIWGEVSQSDRLERVKRLTVLERQLMSIQFPAYGGLYLRSSCASCAASSTCKPLDRNFDPSGSYCVGRSSDTTYIPDNCDGKVDLGPYESNILSTWLSFAKETSS